MTKKDVYIIAGPNGAGKTTFAKTFLPRYSRCNLFVNSDYIAKGLSPFSMESVRIQAGKIFLRQIKDYALQGKTFSFESTLAGCVYAKYINLFKELGYRVSIFYLWVSTVKLAEKRVKERALYGGHSVPVRDIERRYKRSIKNFWRLYKGMAHNWILFDNDGRYPKIIAKKQGNRLEIVDEELFLEISNKYGGR